MEKPVFLEAATTFFSSMSVLSTHAEGRRLLRAVATPSGHFLATPSAPAVVCSSALCAPRILTAPIARTPVTPQQPATSTASGAGDFDPKDSFDHQMALEDGDLDPTAFFDLVALSELEGLLEQEDAASAVQPASHAPGSAAVSPPPPGQFVWEPPRMHWEP